MYFHPVKKMDSYFEFTGEKLFYWFKNKHACVKLKLNFFVLENE